MATEDKLEHIEDIGKLKSEVHTLTRAVEKLFNKFDEWVLNNQPKQLTLATIIGIAVSILTICALLFGTVIYIANSSLAPLASQNVQIVNTLQSMQNSMQQNTSLIQLTNKEMTALYNKVNSNENTLRWMLFDENLPKQITELKVRMNYHENDARLHKIQ